MELVADANEIFSAIIAVSRMRRTKKVEILFSEAIKLHCPALLFRELEKYKDDIKTKAGLSDADFEVFLEILRLRITAVPTEELVDKLEEAKLISPDQKDAPYLAAALKLQCPLWSGDKRLKEQNAVKVFNTKELVELFGL